DVRRLDDRPPFFDLGVVKCGEPLRGLLLARSNIEAEISKAPAHGRIGEGLHHGAVELADNVFRRALGREEAEPARHVEAGYAALVRGRNVGHGRGALRDRLAIALIVPARTCGSAAAPCTTNRSTWPDRRSVMAGPAPR